MAAWIGPAISAGASLLGGLFGKSKEKQSNSIDLKKLVSDSEAAGFNPLTVLRAGGGAGYTQTSHPALSSVNAFGNAMEAVGNFAMNFDAEADKRRGAEYDLVQAQIANIQSETAQRKASMNVPTRIASQAVSAGGRPIASASGSPQWQPVDYTLGSVTNPWADREVNPVNKDAEAAESRYGEFVAEAKGVSNFVDDVYFDELRRARERGAWVTVTPASEKDKKAINDSWLPSWVPRVKSVNFDKPYRGGPPVRFLGWPK